MRSPGLVVLCLLLHPLVVRGTEWEGLTRNGMAFGGTVIRISPESLSLETTGSEGSQQIGIPLAAIEWIQPKAPGGIPDRILTSLESALPLLPRLSPQAAAALEEALAGLAKAGQWAQLHRWTSRMMELQEPAISMEIRILHAWSLWGLGLLGECRSVVREMIARIDPMEADPRLCWLAGMVALRMKNFEEAEFWALLPSLQVPVVKGPLVTELQQLRDSIPAERKHGHGTATR